MFWGIPLVSSWDSVLSLFLTIASLLMIQSVRKNIIIYRRKKRLKDLIADVERIPNDAIPLSIASKKRMEALARNIPHKWYLFGFNDQNNRAKSLKNQLMGLDSANEEKMHEIKELLSDWVSYSEDL